MNILLGNIIKDLCLLLRSAFVDKGKKKKNQDPLVLLCSSQLFLSSSIIRTVSQQVNQGLGIRIKGRQQFCRGEQ